MERKELKEEALDLLKKGVIYVAGRDKHMRPVIVINVHQLNLKEMKIEAFTDALVHIMRVCQNYMHYPGYVENTVFLIEMNKMSMLDFPFKALKNIIDVTSKYFPHTLEKVHILNPSFSLHVVWKIIDAFIPEQSKSKINFVDKSKFFHLLEQIPDINLEEKYGGKLKNFELFWPPLQIHKSDLENFEKNHDKFKPPFLYNPLKFTWTFRYCFYLKRRLVRF